MSDLDILKKLQENLGIRLTQVDNLYDSSNQYLSGKAYTIKEDQITGIVLVNKKLNVLPQEIFKLLNLKVLALIGNNLINLPDDLCGLTGLHTLDLSHNHLIQLPDSIGNLVNLKNLFLNANQLSSLPVSICNLVNIEELNISMNEFKILPECIGWLYNLQTLNIKSNHLQNLPGSIENLIRLYSLKAGYNQFESLPGFIGQLAGLQNLNLSDNQLLSLPDHIEKLVHLRYLNLSNNRLTRLPKGIENLEGLRQLNLDGNRIEFLEDSIDHLHSLQWLSMNSNQLITLPDAIGCLTNLQALFLNSNQLESLPESMGQLHSLETLMAGCNHLNCLPESTGSCTRLQTIDVSSNRLTTLPQSMGQIKNLQTIDVRDNKLSEIPGWVLNLGQPVVWNEFFCDFEINFYNNPLLSPPVEIVKQGNSVIKNYFQQIKTQGKDTIYEAKIMIVGDPGAGKTSLMNKLFNREFKVPAPNQKSTTGIDVRPDWEFKFNDAIDFKAHIWDFGGQQIQYTLHQFFLTTDCLYILMAEKRKEILHLDYWLNIIHVMGRNSPVIVVFNEINIDSVSSFVFDERKYNDLFPDLGLVRMDINLSDISDGRFDFLVNTIKEKLRKLELTGRTVPAAWIKIRKELENRREKKTITINDYFNICTQHNITAEQEQLLILKYFHLLGVVLYFSNDPNLCDTLFLDPNWTVDAVYTVLSDKEIEKSNGILEKDFIDRLWSNKGYNFGQRAKLLQLMLKNNFELCYNLPGTMDKYIVPILLPQQKPLFSWDEKDNLLFRFQYPFMPKGIVSRLIVSLHEYIENQLVWNQGVVLCRRGVRAQVMERITIKEGLKIIEIRLVGIPLLCKEFLTIIREEINRIQRSSFPHLPYDEMIPCNCPKCRASIEPHFFYYTVLEDFLINNDLEIQCMSSRKLIKVTDLIQAVYTSQEMIQKNEALIKVINEFLKPDSQTPLEKFFSEYDFNNSQKQIISDIVSTNLLNKQIAEKLDIEESAFTQRLKKIYKKCGVQSKAELIRKIYIN